MEGQHQEAQEAASEAVTHYRRLTQDHPGVYAPHLAGALSDLARLLSEAGQQQEAQEAVGEAATHYRRLAQASPEVYLPELATTLRHLAAILGGTGQQEDALTVAEEAVTICRELTQADPVAYLPELARSLDSLASRLSEVGQRQPAADAATEATRHYRRLAQASPDVNLPDLAGSLNNLSTFLSAVGRPQEALEAAGEAVTRLRQLTQDHPGAYLPYLATALSNLAISLSGQGQHQEALEAAGEAVTRLRQLTQDHPGAYLPELAMSVSYLAAILDRVGQHQEALEAASEAATRYRQLTQDHPGAYLSHLAASLSNLAVAFSKQGQHQEALEAAREAAARYRQLAQAHPNVYHSEQAASLGNLADRLSEIGQDEQAEDVFTDAQATAGGLSGTGYVLLARSRWRSNHGRLAEAVLDLTAAVSAFDRAGNRPARGQARQELRSLRESNGNAFDQAWGLTGEPRPSWLEHLADSERLVESVAAWINSADLDASRAYLHENSSSLLTDEADAVIEHLIDINPAAIRPPEYLQLLRAARTRGVDDAFAASRERLLAPHFAHILNEWLSAPTWTASRAFAVDHSDELLNPITAALLDGLSRQHPASSELQLFGALLGYAAGVGFDAVYDLLADPARQAAMLSDPATDIADRLALAQMRRGQAADDPEAHFQYAVETLRAIAAVLGTADATLPVGDITAALTGEAAAAVADCAANAAPWEQRDFGRRLAELADEHPQLAPQITELRDILSQ